MPAAGILSKKDNIYLFKSLYKPTSVLDIYLWSDLRPKKVLLKLQYTQGSKRDPKWFLWLVNEIRGVGRGVNIPRIDIAYN